MSFEFSNQRSESALHKLNLITVSNNFEMKLTLKPSSGIGNLVLALALLPFGFSELQSYGQTSFFDTESQERDTLAVSNPQLINEFWAGITGAKSGSLIGIGSDVMNYSSDEMTFTFIVQIKDHEGITVLLMELQNISASPNHSLKPAVFWLPEEDGHYQAEIFVWQSVSNPVPFAPISTVSFNVY